MSSQKQNHIAPLDGVRALAVIAVVVFHLNTSLLPGGFVGVDVFFVLSGYLMMRMIVFDKETGRYNPWHFLVRRFRRLAPALAVVSVVTIILSALVFLPARFDAAFKGAISANLYYSNFLFWQSFDYFSLDADLQPFLHTWSLGVEGQFYLVLPLVVAVLGLLSIRDVKSLAFKGAFALAMIGSLTLSIVFTDVLHKQTGAFYFPLTRFWEMLIGSLVVFVPDVWKRRFPSSVAPSLAGVFLIMLPMIMLDGSSPFPGLNSIAPCIGTALLILAATSRPDPVLKLFSLAPLRWIGLISFSIYLWHWPLIVLYRYAFVTSIGIWDALAIVSVTLLLSQLTYTYVEMPFRKPKEGVANGWKWAQVAVLPGALAASLALAIVIAGDRADTLARQYGDYLAYDTPQYKDAIEREYSYHHCFLPHTGSGEIAADCLTTKGEARTIALLGDSHSAHLLPGLKEAFPDAQFLQANVAGCLPLLDVSSAAGEACTRKRKTVFDGILADQRPDLVILSGRWKHQFTDSLKRTLDHLKSQGHTVAVVGPTPEYHDALPSLLVRLAGSNGDALRLRLAENLRPGLAALDREMEAMAREAGVTYLSVHSAICRNQSCSALVNGTVPFQWDYGHYTREGSVEIVQRLKQSILQAALQGSKDERLAFQDNCEKTSCNR